jgi:phage-related protein
MIIEESFYLSDSNNHNKAIKATGLAIDEIESLVGRFNKNSHRAGQMRGEVVVFVDGSVKIRHHFTKKTIWKDF